MFEFTRFRWNQTVGPVVMATETHHGDKHQHIFPPKGTAVKIPGLIKNSHLFLARCLAADFLLLHTSLRGPCWETCTSIDYGRVVISLCCELLNANMNMRVCVTEHEKLLNLHQVCVFVRRLNMKMSRNVFWLFVWNKKFIKVYNSCCMKYN